MDNGKSLFLTHIYDRYAKVIYKVAFSKLNRDKYKTEEIVQEAFVIACLKVDSIYDSDSVLAWLLRVQDYLIKREHFRLCAGKTEDGKYIFLKEVSIDTVPIEELPVAECEFFEETIFEDLEGILTSRELKFIEERYLNNKKYKEVANTLQMTETACTTLGNRVRQKIKKNFKKV